jgi:hypothetical protein
MSELALRRSCINLSKSQAKAPWNPINSYPSSTSRHDRTINKPFVFNENVSAKRILKEKLDMLTSVIVKYNSDEEALIRCYQC